ncbi:MAG: ABC transporter permease, partial [candidate division Zixibacteria bacterium]|nr:ABC transporter permease [candidate division Zixibacteria bacterium]
MRIRTVETIFKKEMTDTLRDRRTLIFMLAVPIAAIPLLLIVISNLMTGQIEKEMERTSMVLVQGMEFLPDDLRGDLNGAESFTIEPDANSDLNDMIERVKSGEVDALMVVPRSFDKAIALESPTEIEIFYDEAEIRSGFAVDRLDSILASFRKATISARLQQHEISEDVIKPFDITSRNVASMKKVAGETLGAMLPYLISIMCFMGAMYPAIDLAAGEKERGTLETLLVSPASRGEFVVGKYLVILSTGTVAALLSMVSLTFSPNYMASGIMKFTGEILSIDFDLATVILVFMIVLPLAGIFSAILLSVSIFARSFKEAQSYITALNMFIILPAFVSLLPGGELDYKI